MIAKQLLRITEQAKKYTSEEKYFFKMCVRKALKEQSEIVLSKDEFQYVNLSEKSIKKLKQNGFEIIINQENVIVKWN